MSPFLFLIIFTASPDIENEPYKLYKTADELIDEFYYENEFDNDSSIISMEYRELENDNIIRKRKAFKMINKFTEEPDKINKYPPIDSSIVIIHIYLHTVLSVDYSQLYLSVYFILRHFGVYHISAALYVGDQYGIIERVEYYPFL